MFAGEPWQDLDKYKYNCWENYIGAQLYQLCIIDFVVFCFALFFSEVMRNFFINHSKWYEIGVPGG